MHRKPHHHKSPFTTPAPGTRTPYAPPFGPPYAPGYAARQPEPPPLPFAPSSPPPSSFRYPLPAPSVVHPPPLQEPPRSGLGLFEFYGGAVVLRGSTARVSRTPAWLRPTPARSAPGSPELRPAPIGVQFILPAARVERAPRVERAVAVPAVPESIHAPALEYGNSLSSPCVVPREVGEVPFGAIDFPGGPLGAITGLGRRHPGSLSGGYTSGGSQVSARQGVQEAARRAAAGVGGT